MSWDRHFTPAGNHLGAIATVVLHGLGNEGSDGLSVDLMGARAIAHEQGGQDGVAAAVDERAPADGALRSVVGHHADVLLDAFVSKYVSAGQDAPSLEGAFGTDSADLFMADGAHLVCRIDFLFGLLDLLLLDSLGPAAVLALREGVRLVVGRGSQGPVVE